MHPGRNDSNLKLPKFGTLVKVGKMKRAHDLGVAVGMRQHKGTGELIQPSRLVSQLCDVAVLLLADSS